MTADLVTDALIMAIWRRQPDPELLHHSDQGRQYTCEQTQKLLADHGIECSKSVLSGEIDTFLKKARRRPREYRFVSRFADFR